MDLRPHKGSRGRGAAALLAACGLLVLGAPSASARWTIHNDADATNATAPPGGTDTQTCTDRLRGQTGWAVGDSPDTYTPPPEAYTPVMYDIWTPPPGALAGGDIIESGTDDGADYVDPEGNTSAAVFVKHFTTSRRHALNPPQTPSDLFGNYLYTVGTFYTELPNNVAPGQQLGIKPTSQGSTFLMLTAISCSPATPRIDVRPGVSPNNVDPRQTTPLLPVLVYGSSTLDVRTISAVHLQKAGPKSVAANLRRPFDADHDGFLDRTYYFSPKATGIRCGQSSVTLTGRTDAGLRFKGTDTIHTVC